MDAGCGRSGPQPGSMAGGQPFFRAHKIFCTLLVVTNRKGAFMFLQALWFSVPVVGKFFTFFFVSEGMVMISFTEDKAVSFLCLAGIFPSSFSNWVD